MTEPRIYVADLAAYNAAYLHGVWIDACADIEDIQEAINEMLEQSPVHDAEEYAVHDFEGFYNYPISEHLNIEHVHEIACFIEEHGKLGAELLTYFNDMHEAETALTDHYAGCYSSVALIAEELTDDTQQIPEHLARYIDYERMGRDLEMSGDIFTIETGFEEVHIFWSR